MNACGMLCVLFVYTILCRVISIAQLRPWSRLVCKDFVKFALADYFVSCSNPILLSPSSSRLAGLAASKKPRFGHCRLRDELFWTLGQISRETVVVGSIASHLIMTELMLPWPSFPCTESVLLSSQTHVPDIASIAAQVNSAETSPPVEMTRL